MTRSSFDLFYCNVVSCVTRSRESPDRHGSPGVIVNETGHTTHTRIEREREKILLTTKEKQRKWNKKEKGEAEIEEEEEERKKNSGIA